MNKTSESKAGLDFSIKSTEVFERFLQQQKDINIAIMSAYKKEVSELRETIAKQVEYIRELEAKRE
jgi:hypothetical protein